MFRFKIIPCCLLLLVVLSIVQLYPLKKHESAFLDGISIVILLVILKYSIDGRKENYTY
ncbi:MAG: hypothetical protein RLZZ500_1422 [Bacteroidota bacterium]|jgi:chromate transport protein ChrA